MLKKNYIFKIFFCFFISLFILANSSSIKKELLETNNYDFLYGDYNFLELNLLINLNYLTSPLNNKKIIINTDKLLIQTINEINIKHKYTQNFLKEFLIFNSNYTNNKFKLFLKNTKQIKEKSILKLDIKSNFLIKSHQNQYLNLIEITKINLKSKDQSFLNFQRERSYNNFLLKTDSNIILKFTNFINKIIKLSIIDNLEFIFWQENNNNLNANEKDKK